MKRRQKDASFFFKECSRATPVAGPTVARNSFGREISAAKQRNSAQRSGKAN